jgi:hypothetical protein
VFNPRLSASGSLRLTVFRAAHPCDVLAIWFRGLLTQSHDNEDARPCTQAPEPSAAHLAPRASSVGVVVSLGEGFVWINPLDITALKKLEYSWDLFLRSQY